MAGAVGRMPDGWLKDSAAADARLVAAAIERFVARSSAAADGEALLQCLEHLHTLVGALCSRLMLIDARDHQPASIEGVAADIRRRARMVDELVDACLTPQTDG